MKKLFENWNKFINEMEVSGGNLPADHSARQGQKTDVEVLLDDIEDAFERLDYSASSAPIEALLLETAKRMLTETYTDEVPPSLVQIINLIMDRDYETIRSNFNLMWTNLVQYHRDNGIKLQPQVSHNFRTISTTIRNM
tara:strand:- start:50 stop:466 length:417 start_codon:yes stop_codon:yes gene_type:complete